MGVIFDLLFCKKKAFVSAKNTLYTSHVFSLPEISKKDRLIGVKQFYRSYKRIFTKKSLYISNQNGNTLIFSLNTFNREDEIAIIETNSSDKVYGIITKADVLSYGSWNLKILNFILLCFYSFIFAPAAFFSKKNRLNFALLPEHLLGLRFVRSVIRKKKLPNLYCFYTHEPEINLVSYYAMKSGVGVSLVPNANPLFMFNRNLQGDKLYISLSYQKDEASFFYDMPYEKWDVLKTKVHNNQFFMENKVYSKNVIFYYSHASWLRKEEGHNIPYFNEVEMEFSALSILGELVKENKIEIIICLHPKEKNVKKTIIDNYYRSYFGDTFVFQDGDSYDTFLDNSIGFGAFSSVLFERVECGYKTVFLMDSLNDEFPIESSKYGLFIWSLDKINENRIEHASKVSTFEYFNESKYYTFLK